MSTDSQTCGRDRHLRNEQRNLQAYEPPDQLGPSNTIASSNAGTGPPSTDNEPLETQSTYDNTNQTTPYDSASDDRMSIDGDAGHDAAHAVSYAVGATSAKPDLMDHESVSDFSLSQSEQHINHPQWARPSDSPADALKEVEKGLKMRRPPLLDDTEQPEQVKAGLVVYLLGNRGEFAGPQVHPVCPPTKGSALSSWRGWGSTAAQCSTMTTDRVLLSCNMEDDLRGVGHLIPHCHGLFPLPEMDPVSNQEKPARQRDTCWCFLCSPSDNLDI